MIFLAVNGKSQVELGAESVGENGQATLITSKLRSGSIRISAKYMGDDNFRSSESIEMPHGVLDPVAERKLKEACDLRDKGDIASTRLQLRNLIREHPGTIEAEKANEIMKKLPPPPGTGVIHTR
jgi:hypothetical protein